METTYRNRTPIRMGSAKYFNYQGENFGSECTEVVILLRTEKSLQDASWVCQAVAQGSSISVIYLLSLGELCAIREPGGSPHSSWGVGPSQEVMLHSFPYLSPRYIFLPSYKLSLRTLLQMELCTSLKEETKSNGDWECYFDPNLEMHS